VKGFGPCAFHAFTSIGHVLSVRRSLAFPATWMQAGLECRTRYVRQVGSATPHRRASALVPAGARRRFPVSSARFAPGASHGVFKDRPSIDMGSSRPLPRGFGEGGWPPPGSRFGPTLPRVGRVPSSRFLTVLVVCSACCLAGLLHPAADPGVRRVSGCVAGSLRFRWRALLFGALALRSFSLASSRPPFGGSCLPAVRRPDEPVGSTSRLCSAVQVRRGRRCCHRLSLVASLGFAPTRHGGGFGSSEDLHRSLEQSDRGGSSCPTPPDPGAPRGASWLGLRAFEGLRLGPGGVSAAASACRGKQKREERALRRVSFPLCSGCEHPLRIGTGRGPKPSSVAGNHDASGTRSRRALET